MKDYIEKCLRRTVTVEKNAELYQKLPLKYRGMYELYSVHQDGIEWIIAQPQNNVRLNALRHDQKQIEKVTGMNCALYFRKLNHYTKEMLLAEVSEVRARYAIPSAYEAYASLLGMMIDG